MENKPNYYANIPANVRYDKELTASAKLLYGEITALTNAEGYCWANNSYFANLYDMSIRNISRLISQLNNKGYIRVEIIDDFDRKIYLSIAHEKNVQPPIDEKDVGVGQKNRGVQAENVQPPHDKNGYKNNTSINTTNNITSNKKTNKKKNSPEKNSGELENEFEQIWELYPKKEGKADARRHYIKARKTGKVSYKTIENGVYRYLEYLNVQGTEQRYIPMGSTWFCQAKWEDEYICIAPQKKPKNATEYLKAKYGGEPYEPYRNRKIIDYDTEIVSESF